MRPVIANRRPGSGSIDSTIPSSEIHRAIAPSLTANFPFLLTLRLAVRPPPTPGPFAPTRQRAKNVSS